jgi:hypothetical protein
VAATAAAAAFVPVSVVAAAFVPVSVVAAAVAAAALVVVAAAAASSSSSSPPPPLPPFAAAAAPAHTAAVTPDLVLAAAAAAAAAAPAGLPGAARADGPAPAACMPRRQPSAPRALLPAPGDRTRVKDSAATSHSRWAWCASMIFLDKNRCDIGKSQSIVWKHRRQHMRAQGSAAESERWRRVGSAADKGTFCAASISSRSLPTAPPACEANTLRGCSSADTARRGPHGSS